MMQANQTAVPVSQTQDKELVQVQQNINKVLRNLNNQIVQLQTNVNQLMILGEIKFSNLTLGEFQHLAGDDWIQANGQSAVGTLYSSTYGFNVVPNISLAGTNAFIKVN